jgi:apolipoprotein N-acyltransferase
VTRGTRRDGRGGHDLARRFAVALLGGVAVAGSLPPFGFWPLAFLGVALLYLALEAASMRRRLWLGLGFGIGQYAIGLYWAVQFSAAGFVVLVLFEAAFLAIACAACPPGRGRLLALPAWLTLAMWARDHWPFGGLPLGGMALGAVGGPLAPLARLGGPALLVLGTCAAGSGLGALLAWLLGRSGAEPWPHPAEASPRPTALVPGVAAIAFVVVLAALGAVAPSGGPDVRSISFAIVQGGGKRGLDQLEVPSSVVYEAALRPTLKLRPPIDLVLWPEDVVGLTRPLAGSPEKAELAQLARRLHTTLIAGITEPVGRTRFKNFVAAFGPSGRIVARYEKVHRVPFGEYVPDRSFFSHFANLKDIPRNAIPGHGTGEISTPAGPLAVTISFEVFFPARGRSAVRAGGELMVVPTNTSSYKLSQAPTQEIAASRLQAISEGRYLLQAAPTGFSAVVTPSGAVLHRSALSVQDVIEGRVPLRDGATIFERIGTDPILWLSLALAALGTLADRRSKGRQRPAPVAGTAPTPP